MQGIRFHPSRNWGNITPQVMNSACWLGVFTSRGADSHGRQRFSDKLDPWRSMSPKCSSLGAVTPSALGAVYAVRVRSFASLPVAHRGYTDIFETVLLAVLHKTSPTSSAQHEPDDKRARYNDHCLTTAASHPATLVPLPSGATKLCPICWADLFG